MRIFSITIHQRILQVGLISGEIINEHYPALSVVFNVMGYGYFQVQISEEYFG